MIISFFGHGTLADDRKMLYEKIFENMSGIVQKYPKATFYCGHKGDFDILCEKCIDCLKTGFPDIKKVYITPYYSVEYQQKYLDFLKHRFDEIIFPPPCESCPPRYAYSRRNRWMVQCADILLFYVKYTWGGAATALKTAKGMNKEIIFIK